MNTPNKIPHRSRRLALAVLLCTSTAFSNANIQGHPPRDVDDYLNFTQKGILSLRAFLEAYVKFVKEGLFESSIFNLEDEDRGVVNEYTLLAEYLPGQLDYLHEDATAMGLPEESPHVKVYRVNYQTIDPSGKKVSASASVAIPLGTETECPLLAYQHGTEIRRDSAPSREHSPFIPLIFASKGYVVVNTDYLGLGDSNLLHPYLHAKSLATSVIDALRASKSVVTSESVDLNDQLFLIGYSEGGYATMAVHKELEANHKDEFSVTASVPLAGPYDMSGNIRELILDDKPLVSRVYLPYLILAYNEVYGILEDLSVYFKAPHYRTIKDLFNGDNEVNSDSLPSKRDLFTEKFFQDLGTNSRSMLRVALEENDVSKGWKPAAPMYLLHCVKDAVVPFANSQIAFDNFKAEGADNVTLTPVEDTALNQGNVHGQCALPLIFNGAVILERLRRT